MLRIMGSVAQDEVKVGRVGIMVRVGIISSEQKMILSRMVGNKGTMLPLELTFSVCSQIILGGFMALK